jgi:putative transposase
MPSPRVNQDLNDHQTYFLTCTIKRWYYIFDRYQRWDILAKSLKYFIDNKDLKVYSFVFMLNHIHLIISSPDVSGFIRDFKKFTSKKIKENVSLTEPNVLQLFLNENGIYEFWSKTNMPKIIETENFYIQKSLYIENNPVKKNYVMLPEHWYWSSANNICELKVSNYFEN